MDYSEWQIVSVFYGFIGYYRLYGTLTHYPQIAHYTHSSFASPYARETSLP